MIILRKTVDILTYCIIYYDDDDDDDWHILSVTTVTNLETIQTNN